MCSGGIDDVLKDIEEYKTKYKTGKEFATSHNLVQVPYTDTLEDLPPELYYGTVYLIRNNSILSCSTYPTYLNFDIRFSAPDEPIMESVISVYRMFREDLNEFANPQSILDVDGVTSYDLAKTEKFIVALLKNKFKMYVARVE
jgi:hypothetical protein